MRRLYTDEQIVTKLKEEAEGRPARDIMREMGISERTFYRWKSRFGGLEVSEVKQLRRLEEENVRLKGLLADLALENSILKEKLNGIGETLRKNGASKRAYAVSK